MEFKTVSPCKNWLIYISKIPIISFGVVFFDISKAFDNIILYTSTLKIHILIFLHVCFILSLCIYKKTEIKDYGGHKYFVEEKRQMGKDYLQEVKNNLPTDKLRTFYRDHLVEVTLYMKHDDWKSQYIYSVMNYQKLGFRPVSDYAFLDSAIYNFDLKKVAEQ